MSHPRELLPDYVLGALDEREAELLERHLDDCAACRAEVHELNEGLLAMTEALPDVPPPERVWERIRDEVRQPSRRPLPPGRRPPALPLRASPAVRAALGALVLAAALLGYVAFREHGRLERTLAALHQVEEVLTLEREDGSTFGRVFLLEDRGCLMALEREPPEGMAYGVWGYRDGEAVPLGTWRGRHFEVEVPYRGFDTMAITLEPASGGTRPGRVLYRFRAS